MSSIFRPILRKVGAALLCAGIASTATAYPLSYYKTSSVLSEGHWVKVTVDGEGIFQLTYDELRSFGFSDPTKVAVFGYSPLADVNGSFTSTHVDDLPQTAFLHTEDGRILFYGESDARMSVTGSQASSMTRNQYDRKGVYFLSDSQPLKAMAVTSFSPSTKDPFQAHFSAAYIEDEVNNPGEGGVYFFDAPMKAGESRSYTFRIKDFNTTKLTGATGDGFFRYDCVQLSSEKSHLESTAPSNAKITYTYNSDIIKPSEPYSMYSSGYGTIRFQPLDNNQTSLQDEDLTFTVTNPSGSVASYVAMDRARVIYPRVSRLGDERQLIMQYYSATPTGQRIEVYDTPENAVAWNVDNPMNITAYEVRRYAVQPDLMRISLPRVYNTASGPCRIIVFNPSATHPSATYAGDVANTNIHGAETPEMAIITTATLANEARELAAIHEANQGMKVSVFVQDDIFNEFSSGVYTPMAYRRMAKMFYDREPDVFKYLLLYGPSTWDNRGITIPKDDRLVSFQAEILSHASNVHCNYASDHVYGMLSDSYKASEVHFTPMEIVVGRMNLSSRNQAQAANRKIERFMMNPPGAAEYMRVVISSDQGNGNAHFKQSEESADHFNSYLPGLTVSKAHIVNYPLDKLTTDAHTILMTALNRGQGFFGYCGHGQPARITGVQLLTTGQLADESFDTSTFAYFSSCDLFSFDRTPSLMDAMIAAETGGIIGGVGASRSVYLEYNQDLYLAVCDEYAMATPGTTYGQLLQQGRNKLVTNTKTSSASAVNAMSYNFCGDPALQIPVPRYKMVIDKINGETYSSESTIKFSPITKITVSGHIIRNDGKSGDNFNGTGLIEVYDTPRESNDVPVTEGSSTVNRRALFDYDLLGENPIEVKNGAFVAEIVIPEITTYGELNRIVLSARDEVSGDLAAGTATNTALAEVAEGFESPLDPAAPSIVDFYIDSPDFRSGDVVNPEFTVYAEIAIPESGINLSENGMSQTAYLTFDTSSRYPEPFYTGTYTDHGTYKVTRKFTDIADGRHSIALSVGNNLGNTAQSTIDFYVLSSELSGELTCEPASESADAEATPAVKGEATFDFSHNSETDPECTLLICDAEGNTVCRKDNVSFPYVWNLKGSKGADVPEGRYTARLLLKSGSVHGGTAPIEFVVIQ